MGSAEAKDRDQQRVIEGFTLLRRIGVGASGRVWLARQLSLDREVALKIIDSDGESGLRRSRRLVREAQLAGQLDHPGLVRAIAAGRGEGFAWLAMEYVAGLTLAEHLEANGPLTSDEVVALGQGIANALDYAHSKGVIHRDVKPANIILEEGSGRPRLLDLGLARRDSDVSLTADQTALGTPQFMAPEQASNPKGAGPAADQFALAATLYAALSGRPPFEGGTVAEVLTRLLYKAPTPLPKGIAARDPRLVRCLLKGLEKDPRKRFASIGEFSAALGEVRLRNGSSSPDRRPWPKTKPLFAGAMASLLLAVALITVWPRGERQDENLESKVIAQTAPPLVILTERTALPQMPPPIEDASSTTPSEPVVGMNAATFEEALALLQAEVHARLLRSGDATLARLHLSERCRELKAAHQSVAAASMRAAPLDLEGAERRLSEQLEVWIADLGAEQLAGVIEVLEAQRGLLAAGDFRREEIEQRIDQALLRLGPLGAMNSEQRRERDQRRSAIVGELAAAPHERWATVREQVLLDLDPSRLALASAGRKLAQNRALVERLGRPAILDWESLDRRSTEIKGAKLQAASELLDWLAEAEGLSAPIEANDLVALRTAYWKARSELVPEPAEIPGLSPILEESDALMALLERVGDLRTRLGRAAAETRNIAAPFLLPLRSSRNEERLLQLVAAPNADEAHWSTLRFKTAGKVETISVSELDPLALLRLWQLLPQSEVDRQALSALSSLEGDALTAAILCRPEAASQALMRLRAAAENRQRRALPEGFRQTFDQSLRAYRAFGEGDFALARLLLEEAQGLIPKRSRRTRESVALTAALEAMPAEIDSVLKLASALKEVEPFAGPRERLGVTRYEFSLAEETALAAVLTDRSGISRTPAGICVNSDARAIQKGPELGTTVPLSLPPLEQALQFDLELLVRPKGVRQWSFFSLEAPGLSILCLGDLGEVGRHRARSLNGAERDLIGLQSLRKAAIFGTPLREWRSEWPTAFVPWPASAVLDPDGVQRLRVRYLRGGRVEFLFQGESLGQKSLPREVLPLASLRFGALSDLEVLRIRWEAHWLPAAIPALPVLTSPSRETVEDR